MLKAHKRTTVEAIRHSLVELRRLFQRKELVEWWAAAAGKGARLDYGDLRLLDAVGTGSTTVGDVSRALGVDPSRASRHVAKAVRVGLLRRRAEQDDARKVVLEVTARGAALQAKGTELTRTRIALAIASWSADDRERFARLFERFSVAITARAAPQSRRST